MTLWEYTAMYAGFARANAGEEKVEPPSVDEFDAAVLADARRQP